MKTIFGKRTFMTVAAGMLAFSLAACGNSEESGSKQGGKGSQDAGPVLTLEELAPLAKEEGKVVSVGMPDTWANWKDTWADLTNKYGLEHSDTDMGSADEINKFAAEKNKPTADIGDVGIAFGPVAVEKGVTQPYKTQYWDEIPEWAKDKDGHWMVAYTGSIGILCNKELVSKCPTSWADMESATDYQIALGDVIGAAQAQHVILAAAFAFGGDESNIQPGLDYFKRLAEKGRLSKVDISVANIQKGEVAVGLMWDFNALGNRDQLGPDKFEVAIPEEGSVISGYATIINKYAPHPNAAKLARTYILSDEGQINLAKGYARPIRSSVKLPAEVEAKLIPQGEYKNTKPIKDYKVWENTVKELSIKWQEEVQIHIK
ncbi:ABC transporter substrate-binding protein [Paenibacillus dakarensis]|uniref:ABC transporter substrate-binding protein n=1 Tax=Paenibacillus dakarensis TaxID=1527293 RepID=UPI001FE098CE|nr:extracellular solute-binding protein [Paenibacillus dakarensis]